MTDPTEPAYIERDPATGIITREVWLKDGQRHRIGGPAYSVRSPKTGIVTYEIWRSDGRIHRDDGPAYIWRDPATGTVTDEIWYNNGNLVAWYKNGKPFQERTTPARRGIMDQTPELKALIGRLQPGELLQFGERAVEEYFFARVADARADGSGTLVEVLWLEFDGVDSLMALVDGMAERGELAETDYCSHWKLP